MHVATTTESPLASDADTIAIGVFEDNLAPGYPRADVRHEHPARPPRELEALLASGEARGSFKALALTHAQGRRWIVAGLGPRAQFDPERARVAAGLVLRRAEECGARTLCWELPDGTGDEIVDALATGTILAAYRFDRYRPAKGDEPAALQRLLVSAERDVSAPAQRAAVLAAAQNRARDLANAPANHLTPAALADYADELASGHESLTATVLDGAEIRARGMGAFAAVAQGSEQDPRLIVLEYEPRQPLPPAPPDASAPADVPAPPAAQRLALIGKAVTFDSGGLSLKPPASQIDMKFDMCGGAAVIEAIGALAQLDAPARVLGLVGAAENMISGRAVKPGDIVTALDGTTIEVNNTDAEGRLVLADCITHARREGCDAIVDIATLTGAVMIALGSTYAGLMSNDDILAQRVQACGEATGELVWRMPLHPAYAELINGRFARLTNRTERREAGAITAAEFLHHFAGDVPWAHLDIAGTADHGHVPYLNRGGTGFGVRLLSQLALGFTG